MWAWMPGISESKRPTLLFCFFFWEARTRNFPVHEWNPGPPAAEARSPTKWTAGLLEAPPTLSAGSALFPKSDHPR